MNFEQYHCFKHNLQNISKSLHSNFHSQKVGKNSPGWQRWSAAKSQLLELKVSKTL